MHYFNNDQVSIEAKWKLKLKLLESHPEAVTWHQQHLMFSPQKRIICDF